MDGWIATCLISSAALLCGRGFAILIHMNPSEKSPRVVLLTGDGKGKTSSALGMAMRAAGHGMRVFFLQFMKQRRDIGEAAALARFPEVEFVQSGLGFVPPATSPAFARHKDAAEAGLADAAAKIASGEYDMVVLDEACGAIALGLLDAGAVLAALRQARPGSVIVLTGRDAPQSLVDFADTVSHVDCVKHGYETGWPAMKGVEL